MSSPESFPAQIEEDRRVKPADIAAESLFGYSVDIDGSLAVVGAPDANFYQGAVYVYERAFPTNPSSWQEKQEILPPAGSYPANFGWSTAVQGTRIAIGDQYSDDSRGGVFIYDRPDPKGSWELVAKLRPLRNGGRFGSSLAMSREVLAVGAPLNEVVYIYSSRDGGRDWFLEAVLSSPNPQPDREFGRAISLRDGLLAVSDLQRHPPVGLGSVFLFRKTSLGGQWEAIGQLDAENPVEPVQFGQSVAIGDRMVVVGSPKEGRDGHIYIFEPVGPIGGDWVRTAMVEPHDLRRWYCRFGHSTSVEGRRIAVGAPWHNYWGSHSGAVYVVEESKSSPQVWRNVARVVASDGTADSLLGFSSAVSGSTILGGAIYDSWQEDRQGAAYFRDLNSVFVEDFESGHLAAWSDYTVCDGCSVADFSYSTQGDYRSFDFTSLSTGEPQLSYSWDFGDGCSVPCSTDADPTHRFPAWGIYRVALTVSNSLGTDTTIRRVVVD